MQDDSQLGAPEDSTLTLEEIERLQASAVGCTTRVRSNGTSSTAVSSLTRLPGNSSDRNAARP